MANRNWTDNPDRKISSSGGVKDMGAGQSGKVAEKTANWPGLPGKPSNWYGSKGPKVKVHPKSQGLC